MKFTRIKSLLTALAMIAAGSLTASASASASAVTLQERGLAIATSVFASANPQAAYRQLNATEQSLFKAAETPTSFHSSVGVVSPTGVTSNAIPQLAGYTGCWSLAINGWATGTFGNTLYTYGESVQVCAIYSSVTSVSVFNVWQETSTPGWRFDPPTSSTYNANWEGRGATQFRFILGVGGWDIQHDYPCLQLRLNGNGSTYSSSMSCNLS